TASHVQFVTSKDGTRIAVESTPKHRDEGPPQIPRTKTSAETTLLIVHGGTGDRRRWQPLLPLFAPHFTLCLMDRRGHGSSEPGSDYSLQKESEDVAAVVNSRLGPVSVLGHSIGGVFALEAAFLTQNISKLVLYEPPLQDLDHGPVADRIEKMIQAGNREQALETFMREIVMVSPTEVAAMKVRPNWHERFATIDIQIREIRALSKYRFDARRIRKIRTPTLLLTGSKTASPQLKQAISSLLDALPNRQLFVLEGQEH